MKIMEVNNKRFDIEFGVIVAPEDKRKIPSYLVRLDDPEKGYFWLKESWKNYKIFYWDISPERLAAVEADMADFNKRLEEVQIMPLPEYLDVTRDLWDASYTYYPNRYDWLESFSFPPQAGAELIEKIREGITAPVVLKDDKGYWEIPAPKGTDGIFKEKYSPTVILPKGYKFGARHRIVYRNVGRGALTDYWGDYRI